MGPPRDITLLLRSKEGCVGGYEGERMATENVWASQQKQQHAHAGKHSQSHTHAKKKVSSSSFGFATDSELGSDWRECVCFWMLFYVAPYGRHCYYIHL